ncbi:hypothetical protein [Xanthobacter flavus]|uniref:hypothetical protein n=1 Tax=Xanthobacter flavus TaxID=281 RepID=UPI00372B7FFB
MKFPSEPVGGQSLALSARMKTGNLRGIGRAEAYTSAARHLAARAGNVEAAVEDFLKEVQQDRGGRMLQVILDDATVNAALAAFLNSVAADMRGDALNASPVGQPHNASTEADDTPPLGDAPHAPAGQPTAASSEAPRRPPAGAPQSGTGGQIVRASTEATYSAPPIPAPPSPQARAVARAALTAVSDNLLDTYLIDGVPIGDLRMDQVRRLAKVKREQSEVLAAIAAHAGGASGHMRVREVYTNLRLTRELARAERKAHAITC